MKSHFLGRDRRRKHAIVSAVMAVLSLCWVAGTIASICVAYASAAVQRGGYEEYYSLLTYRIPAVSSDIAIWALVTFPVATVAAFLLGYLYLEDDDYKRAIGFNLLPCLNILVLLVDALM